MRSIIVFIALLLSSACATARTDAIVAAGIGKDVVGDGPFERYGSVGVQYGDVWKVRANGGYWLSPGGVSSGFASMQGGLEVDTPSGFFGCVLFGPAVISNPGGKLAGPIQFHLSGCGGVKNAEGYGIGGQWVHLSNAGILQPNLGLDVWSFLVLIPFGGKSKPQLY